MRINNKHSIFDLWVILPLIFATLLFFIVTSQAGLTLTAGGFIIDAADSTTADGGEWLVYEVQDPSFFASGLAGAYQSGYWAGEIGAYLYTLTLGNELICFLEKCLDPSKRESKGYYAVMNHFLNNSDPAEFSDCTLREIPIPTANLSDDDISISWQEAVEDSSDTNIVGYNLFRSSDGIIFNKINPNPLTQTSHTVYDLPAGDYIYTIGLVYRGSPSVEGDIRSANSQPIIFCRGDFNSDNDVDGSDLYNYILNLSATQMDEFSTSFGK